MASPTREETEALIAASEARNETKLARFEGKLDLVISKLDAVRDDNKETRDVVRESGRGTRANIWVVGLGLAVLIVALATLFPVVFDLGAKFQDKISEEIESRVEALPPGKPTP